MQDERKSALIKRLEARLKEDEDIGKISVFTAEELKTPMDILRAEVINFGPELVSVLGEFLFLPLDGGDNLFFSTVVTISSSIPKEAVPDMAAAIARINYYVPFGCYALGDDDQNFIYRCTVPVRVDDDEDRQLDAMYDAVDAALMVAERFVGYIILVLNNEITVEEMLDMVQGSDNG